MKHREHTTPMLPPEAYIHLWKAAAQPKIQRPSALKRLVAKLLAISAMILAACSVEAAPRVIRVESGEPCVCTQKIRSLVWVQPAEWRKAERAEVLPLLTGNPYGF
jgi:hypothetical protein